MAKGEGKRKQEHEAKHGCKRRVARWVAAVVVAVVVLACAGFGVYVNDYYHAQPSAVAALEGDAAVQVEHRDGYYVFAPTTTGADGNQTSDSSSADSQMTSSQPVRTQVGFIFYPGAKVEPAAYAPLARAFAEQGVLFVVLEPPCNLAILNQNQADGVQEAFPQVSQWYIGGHSLGGVVAANYANKHADAFSGVVFLASYSTADLRDSGLRALSVCGTNDGVLNWENYEKDKANLPEDAVEVKIEGGCHSYFADYGIQEGDGVPSIQRADQIAQTVDAFLAFM